MVSLPQPTSWPPILVRQTFNKLAAGSWRGTTLPFLWTCLNTYFPFLHSHVLVGPKMKTRISFCLVLLFPVCHAQCDLNLPDSHLVNALNEADLLSESDPTKFTLQDLTYLCVIRSSVNNTRFDQVRVSILYTFDSATVRSAQATFTLCLSGSFRFSSANTYTVTQDPHLTENMTREDCQDCLDNSTFARPTFCRRKHCYI